MFPAHQAAKEKAAEAGEAKKEGKHTKVPGTEIQQLKGGVTVRVCIKSGVQFAPDDVESAKSHVKKVGGENAGKEKAALTQQPQGGKKNGQNWGGWGWQSAPWMQGMPWWAQQMMVAKGWGKGKAPQQPQQPQKMTKAMKKAKKKEAYEKMTPEKIEEKRAKARERDAKKLAAEQRVMVDNKFYSGEVVQRYQMCAWVKPKNPAQIPAKVQPKLKEMNAALREKTKDSKKGFLDGKCDDTVNVIYVRLGDIVQEGLVLKTGVAVKFRLYTDTKGVGGCEVKGE